MIMISILKGGITLTKRTPQTQFLRSQKNVVTLLNKWYTFSDKFTDDTDENN